MTPSSSGSSFPPNIVRVFVAIGCFTESQETSTSGNNLFFIKAVVFLGTSFDIELIVGANQMLHASSAAPSFEEAGEQGQHIAMERHENNHSVSINLDQSKRRNKSVEYEQDVRRVRRRLIIATVSIKVSLILTRRAVAGDVYAGKFLRPFDLDP